MLTNNPCIEYKRMIPAGNTSSALRKGAWTGEEDIILKNYIQKFGEGKWHLLPLKAGLNRCRKSCRLRWLNYLRPNIKRGDFEKDEVDLIHRLHKLLGNRWSLIAGRIPGRTANDVKNYWNTHVRPRSITQKVEHKHVQRSQEMKVQATLVRSYSIRQKVEHKDIVRSQDMKVQVIKPRAHKVSKTFMYPQIAPHDKSNLIMSSSSNNGFDNGFVISPPAPSGDKVDECLNELFEECDNEMNDEIRWSLPVVSVEERGLDVVRQEDGENGFIPMDDAFWSFLD